MVMNIGENWREWRDGMSEIAESLKRMTIVMAQLNASMAQARDELDALTLALGPDDLDAATDDQTSTNTSANASD
jgi:hypothetical protein